MGCVIRASGEDFLVDDFINKTSLIPCNVYRKGQPKFPTSKKNAKLCDTSGLNINVSDADFSDLAGQISEAILFLKKYKSALKILCQYEGVEDVRLDFGVEQREEAIIQYEYFPPELITLAGRLRMGIEISFYPSSENLNKILPELDAERKKKKEEIIKAQ